MDKYEPIFLARDQYFITLSQSCNLLWLGLLAVNMYNGPLRAVNVYFGGRPQIRPQY